MTVEAHIPSSSSNNDAFYDVVIVGAGIVGPSMAVALSKQNRRVALIERDLSEPNRIVGELMQPSGIHSLEKLGLESCVEGIEAIPAIGYQIFYQGESINLPYPDLETPKSTPISPEEPAAKISDICRVRETGRSFHHGRFIMNLRKAAMACKPNVDVIEATVTTILTEDQELEPREVLEAKQKRIPHRIVGVSIKETKTVGDVKETTTRNIFAPLTIVADGTTSKFRKGLTSRTPKVKSHFVGLILEDADIPKPYHGHVILGTKFAPVLVYQIDPHETRALFDIQGPNLPSVANGDMKTHLLDNVLPNLPEQLQPSVKKAILKGQFRSMPNQFLPTSPQRIPGVIVLGDAWNMRHPLTGGGMTVALNDVVLLSERLGLVGTFDRWDDIEDQLDRFYWERKKLGSVVNILAQALYSLFAAKSDNLIILQKGCFEYFQRGGKCVEEPISLLSGILPRPVVLVRHFFAVAFYAIYCNYLDKGLKGFPLAFIQSFTVLYTATVVILPYIIEEIKWY